MKKCNAKMASVLFSVAITALGCSEKSNQNKALSNKNRVLLKPGVSREIGNQSITFDIREQSTLPKTSNLINLTSLMNRLNSSEAKLNQSPSFDESSVSADVSSNENGNESSGALSSEPDLKIGFPVDHLNKPFLFGASIIKIDEKQNPVLGSLKLTQLPPFSVQPRIDRKPNGEFVIALKQCEGRCVDRTQGPTLLELPLSGISPDFKFIYVDVRPLGNEMDLHKFLDGTGERSGYISEGSKTIAVDFSHETLVFDIQSHLKSLSETGQQNVQLVTRWYLRKLSQSVQIPRRTNTEGVGFFATAQSAQIHRFNLEDGIHYYVKSVPENLREPIELAFEEWNKTFEKLGLGQPLTYEFLEANSEFNETVQAGDIRFNVLEWDEKNVANYNGFGPQIVHPLTGQILAAHILIQGPNLLGQAIQTHPALRQMMEASAASEATVSQSIQADQGRHVFKLELFGLKFHIVSQDKTMSDMVPVIFDPARLGDGRTYAFHTIRSTVAHEIGHNLGLRHNFKGSLHHEEGESTSSVMDYLDPWSTHLRTVGSYDEMAIAYGYLGQVPEKTNGFCTDQEVGSLQNPAGNAECGRFDLTADPYGHRVDRLREVVDRITGQLGGPVESVEFYFNGMVNDVLGLLTFAALSHQVQTWEGFLSQPQRPTSSQGVKALVLSDLKSIFCADEQLSNQIQQISSDEQKAMASQNAQLLQVIIDRLIVPQGVYSAEELNCPSSADTLLVSRVGA